MTDDVASPSKAYLAMAEKWKLPRTLMGGTPAMRKAGKAYLPQEPAESDDAYKDRLNRSTLFNGFKRAVDGVTGKVFSKPIVLGDDVPQNLVDWSENADLAGRNLDTFARDVFYDGVQTGLSHVLVDMQRAIQGATLADERASGRRPYMVHVPAENLIGWRSETINGVETLTQIRIREIVTVPDGLYGEKEVERVRVLWPDQYEIWERDEDSSQWVVVEEGPLTLGYIPLATFYTNRTGFMMAEPPLEDLAYLNAQHWQSASDQRHILHVARVPLLFGAGLGQDDDGAPIEVGPNRLIRSNDPDAKLSYVEHRGAAIEAGRNDLRDLEDQMRLMGLELMLPKTGNQTATAKAIDSAEANSQAKAMALALKDALENAFMFMGNWAGLPGDASGSVQVNTDYGVSLRDAADIQELTKARMAGEITRETYWGELKRRGVLSDDFDPDQEVLRLDEESPALGTIGEAEEVPESEVA